MLLAALTTFTFIFGSNFVVCRLQFVHVWHFLQKDEKEEQKKRFVSLNAQSETLSYSMRCIAHRHSRSGVTNILVHNFIINFTSHEQTLDLHIHYLFNWLRVTKIGLTILFVYAFSFLSAFAAPYACVCEPARAHTRPVLFINFYVPGFAHVLFQRFFHFGFLHPSTLWFFFFGMLRHTSFVWCYFYMHYDYYCWLLFLQAATMTPIACVLYRFFFSLLCSTQPNWAQIEMRWLWLCANVIAFDW